MTISLNYKRTTQPQGAVGVNSGSALNAGLAHAWTTLNFPLRDPAGGALGLLGVGSGGTTGTYPEVGIKGRHIRFNDAGTGTTESKKIAVGDSAGSGGPAGNTFTFFCLINPGSIGAFQTIFGGSATSGGIQIRLNTSGQIYFDRQGTANIGVSSSGVTAGIWSSIAISYDGTNAAYYINGRTAGTSSSTQSFSKVQYALGFASGGESISNGSLIAAPAIWNRVLSAGEHAAVAGNPWQLFAPETRRVWVPSAGGGSPYTLPLAVGSYATTGNAVNLVTARKLSFNSGTYTATGQAATLLVSRKLPLNTTSYSVTGNTATLKVSRKLLFDVGSYSFTGYASTLTYTPAGGGSPYTLALDAGSYSFSGQAATLKIARKLAFASSSYTITGLSATLKATRKLAFNAGSYTFNGNTVSLTYSGAPASSMPPYITVYMWKRTA